MKFLYIFIIFISISFCINCKSIDLKEQEFIVNSLCKHDFSGDVYDLSSLTKQNGNYGVPRVVDPNRATYAYRVNFCAPVGGVSQQDECNKAGDDLHQYIGPAYACQYQSLNSPNPSTISKLGTWEGIQWSRPKSDQIVFVTNNGETCGRKAGAPRRKVIFTLQCAEKVGPITVNNAAQSCDYYFHMNTPVACDGHGSGGSGASFGTVFLWLFFVSLFLYIAIGCVFNIKKNEKRGMEAFPNLDGWKNFFGLVKEGFRFTLGGCKSESGSYEAV